MNRASASGEGDGPELLAKAKGATKTAAMWNAKQALSKTLAHRGNVGSGRAASGSDASSIEALRFDMLPVIGAAARQWQAFRVATAEPAAKARAE